ncbi:lysophospholipid acyltransferase family protein [Chthonobacter albigriseus]|uniref:lysophospholipid acyltransferase family protein n=1 Tax=Chthonobacter albigriseus TaxID=1683161 RepID=UPI0015EED5EA|nr:lysophospholipid acyltransferase family protein [Chthonobacter albigriseus]
MDNLIFSYADPTFPPLKRNLIRLIERATGQPELKRLYLENRSNPVPGESFFQAAVRRLQITVDIDEDRLAGIPRSGPLVVVANHPFGVLDGIVISWLIEKVRSDFLVLTNAVLLRAPEVKPYLLPVDFAETEEALATNLATRQAARRHLEAGGCIVVFPAGGVSTAPDRLGRRDAIDATWQPFTSQLIQRTRATVVPVFFAGQNSRIFQIASHIHQALRLSLIFKEVRDRIGTSMPVAIGDPIPYASLADLADRRALMDHLRACTYALGARFAHLQKRGERRRSIEALRGLPHALRRNRQRRRGIRS